MSWIHKEGLPTQKDITHQLKLPQWLIINKDSTQTMHRFRNVQAMARQHNVTNGVLTMLITNTTSHYSSKLTKLVV